MITTWCVGNKQKNKTKNFNEHKKLNPKTQKLVKFIKGTCGICGQNRSQVFAE